jgi:hypothetical protein
MRGMQAGQQGHDELRRLAELLAARDTLDTQIAAIVGRSARPGDVGEFIAALIFDIQLAATATQPGYDGVFRAGPLAGKTVNVKTYGNLSAGLDIPAHPCDYALVLTGPPRPGHARGQHRPWRLTEVYLFELTSLLEVLRGRGVKIGIATSLRAVDLAAARIFPPSDRAPLQLSAEQWALLRLFAGESADP